MDKYTAKFTYGKPKPMFIYNMTRGGTGGGSTIAPLPCTPSHYMKEFHEDTTTDKAALEADVKKRGFDGWEKYYMQFARQWTCQPRPADARRLGCQERPTPRNSSSWSATPTSSPWTRKGNQLPYIDKVTHRLFEDRPRCTTCG